MKKKSLLILPVLLLALAACNKEEEEVVEENPEVTDTTGGDDEGTGGTGTGEEDTHTQPPVLEETEATASVGLFDFAVLTADDSDRYNSLTLEAEADEEAGTKATEDTVTPLLTKAWKEPVEATDPASIDADEAEDSVPWTVTDVNRVYPGANGDPTNANNDYWQLSNQCLQFSSSSVNGSLTLDFGETEIAQVKISAIAWNSSASTLDVVETPEVADEGDGNDGDGNDGGDTGDTGKEVEEVSTAKTITQSALDTSVVAPLSYSWNLDGANSITISATGRVLVFSITVLTEAEKVALTNGPVELHENTGVYYENPSDGSLSIASVVAGEDENNSATVTYTLAGAASMMDEDQGADFYPSYSAKDDKYIIINVSFEEDESVTWVSSAGDTRVRTATDYPECEFDMVIRISGEHLSDEIQEGYMTVTIAKTAVTTDTAGSETSVTHIVDFSALVDLSENIPE